jgi:hypothetical protein
MTARVDVSRREVAAGERRVGFRLDCRADTAAVRLGGTDFVVRPLRWREKVTLARFAELGPELLREELIHICTVGSVPDDLPAEDAEVLWTLAAWMSEPPSSSPVPLDSRSVAGVTLRLCKAMGLRPADFDDRSAPEVEAMWEALGGGTPATDSEPPQETSSPTSTKILIVPDPEGERASRPPAAGRPARREEAPATDSGSPPSTKLAPDPEGERASRPPAAGRPARREEAANTVANDSGSPQETSSSTSPAAGRPARREEAANTATRDVSPLAGGTPARLVSSRPSGGGRFALRAADAWSGGAARVQMERTDEPANIAPPADLDALFEELADRLEQAAADAGIGEG